MLDFNSDQVEVDLAQDAVLQMELGVVELKFDVEALLDAHLHLDWPICVRLHAHVGDDELLFLRYAVVIAVNHHVYVISQVYHYTIVGLELLFNSVELKIVRHIVCQCPGRLQIPNDLKESRILVLVVQVFNHSYQLYADAQVIYFLVFVQRNGHLTLDVFSILKDKSSLIQTALTVNIGAL